MCFEQAELDVKISSVRAKCHDASERSPGRIHKSGIHRKSLRASIGRFFRVNGMSNRFVYCGRSGLLILNCFDLFQLASVQMLDMIVKEISLGMHRVSYMINVFSSTRDRLSMSLNRLGRDIGRMLKTALYSFPMGSLYALS